QPLIPADQPATQPQQQAPQQPQQPPPGSQSPSPLFSVPHPPSDAARWLRMVQAPFLSDQNGPAGTGSPESPKMARVNLRAAMREGRQSWLRKLAGVQSEQAQSQPALPRLPRLLVKVAQPGWGYQQGWYQPQQIGGGYPQAPGLTPPGLAP